MMRRDDDSAITENKDEMFIYFLQDIPENLAMKRGGGYHGSMAGNQAAPGAFCVGGGRGV